MKSSILKKKPVLLIIFIIMFGIVAQLTAHFWPKPAPVVETEIDKNRREFSERHKSEFESAKSDSDKATALLNEANYVRSYDKPQAERIYKEAEKLDGKNIDVLFNLCNYYYIKKDAANATDYCNKTKQAIQEKQSQTDNLEIIEVMLGNIRKGTFNDLEA